METNEVADRTKSTAGGWMRSTGSSLRVLCAGCAEQERRESEARPKKRQSELSAPGGEREEYNATTEAEEVGD
jgi:hypothetical protein